MIEWVNSRQHLGKWKILKREAEKPRSMINGGDELWFADHFRCRLLQDIPQDRGSIDRPQRQIALTDCENLKGEILSGHFGDALADGERGGCAGGGCIQYVDRITAPSNHEIID